MVASGEINPNTGKAVLAEMFTTGRAAREIVLEGRLAQVSDSAFIARIVAEALDENPAEVASYKAGKTTVANWLFGQIMKKAGGRADPQAVRAELERKLNG
jgi:aspartyl-tRNA(Asn)/glutamyl-tRNA(Gln) amidotransferase subunit B